MYLDESLRSISGAVMSLGPFPVGGNIFPQVRRMHYAEGDFMEKYSRPRFEGRIITSENSLWTDEEFPKDFSAVSLTGSGHEGRNVYWVRAGDLYPGAPLNLERTNFGNPRRFRQNTCKKGLDICQSPMLADCWLLATLACMQETGKVVALSPGKYQVSLWQAAINGWAYINVDDYLPCFEGPGKFWEPSNFTPIFTRAVPRKPTDQSNFSWRSLLIEKAFAKATGGYSGMNFARGETAAVLLWAASVQTFTVAKNDISQQHDAVQTYVISRRARENDSDLGNVETVETLEFLSALDAALSNKDMLVTAGTRGEGLSHLGLYSRHLFSVFAMTQIEVLLEGETTLHRILQLRDPYSGIRSHRGNWAPDSDIWGRINAKTFSDFAGCEVGGNCFSDGFVYLDVEEFLLEFEKVFVSTGGPESDSQNLKKRKRVPSLFIKSENGNVKKRKLVVG